MDIVIIIGIATLIYTLVGFGYNIIDYCIDRQKKKDYEKLDNHEDYIIGGHIDYNNNMNRQTVYKVDGDFNGDIKGDNVTVILMGNGNFNGDISSKDGEVVLIKGNINGDVKANKIVCPTEPTTEDKDQYICKSCYHYVQTPTGSYCTESSVLEKALPVGCRICKSYDRTGEAAKYKSDCASFSNRSGIQQGASPVKRIDYMYGDTCLSAYNTYPIVHMKCPHCKKRFGTQLKVQTNISDGDVLVTNVEVIEHGH